MTRLRAAVLLCTCAAMAASAGALASAGAASSSATPKAKLIVLGRSIGVVALGQTEAVARAALQGHLVCVKTFCFAPDKKHPGLDIVLSAASGGTVAAVQIDAAKGFTGPTAAFRTAAGIRLGSHTATVKRAYPKLKIRPSTGEVEGLLRAGAACTHFAFKADRVDSIRVVPNC